MRRDLPPGQREIPSFPRFGLLQYAQRFPGEPSERKLEILGAVEQEVFLPDALEGLPRVEQTSDFHCVTTWSHRALRWGGVRFVDFYEKIVVPRARPSADANYLLFRGQDRARSGLPLEDLLSPDVLLADTLDGEPLSIEHGAPLRLVAPRHYGYKSVKHLSRIELRHDAEYRPSAFRFMDHPRARVDLEERGRGFPGWMLRYLYRPLIKVAVSRFAEAMDEYRANRKSRES